MPPDSMSTRLYRRGTAVLISQVYRLRNHSPAWTEVSISCSRDDLQPEQPILDLLLYCKLASILLLVITSFFVLPIFTEFKTEVNDSHYVNQQEKHLLYHHYIVVASC